MNFKFDGDALQNISHSVDNFKEYKAPKRKGTTTMLSGVGKKLLMLTEAQITRQDVKFPEFEG